MLTTKQIIANHRAAWIKPREQYKAMRIERGLTLKYTAEMLGLSPRNLSYFENGLVTSKWELLRNAYSMFLLLYDLGAFEEILVSQERAVSAILKELGI